MLKEHILERQQIIERPLDEVFTFFANAANLETITPPWLNFVVLTPLPFKMITGTLIDYRIRLFGMPMQWKTEIEAWQPMSHFVDRQLRGPYALCHHTHEFRETDGGVLMTDRVRYRIPYGPIGQIAHKLFVARWLDQIFDYRQERIAELLSVKTQVCAKQ